MTKELEALEEIKTYIEDNITTKYNHVESEFKIIKSALKRLESIDNSNPSEALEALDYIENKLGGLRYECERTKSHRCDDLFIQEHIFTTIKQALLELQALKEAKPSEVLENLKYLKNLTKVKDVYNVFYWNQSYEKVEKALITKTKKELAWNIVKEKRIDLESFYTSFIEGDYDYSFYERYYGTYGKYELTEEEFKLLKEVLCYE